MAWIGAVISAASSLYGAYQQSKTNASQSALIGEQVDTSRQLRGTGAGLFGQGSALEGPAINRLTALASGSRPQIWNAIAPEAQDLSLRSDAAQQTASNLMGRGGGRAGILASQPYAKVDALNRLFMASRANANDQLIQIADEKQRMGLGAIGGSLGGLQGALSGSLKVAEANRQASADVGAGLADAWNQFYKWYSSRGTSTADTAGIG